MYFVLAAVGLFTLLVGASVRLRRPHDQATLHFFWLCVAFFGAFTFSFNGPFDRLDWMFYWGDAVAQAVLPPLLLHFTLGFPQRPPWRTTRPMRSVLPLVYLPAILLIGIAHRDRGGRPSRTARCFRALSTCSIAPSRSTCSACAAAAIVVLARAFGEITSLTGRRQLRWIAWGTALGVGPFALGYALPWALGVDPPLALQLTAMPLGLVPLTFASAIVRYRLRDVEVIIKRGARVYRISGGERAAVFRDAAAGRVRVRQRRRSAQLDRRRCSRQRSSCCSRSPSRRPSRTRSIGCSTAIATTTAGRSSPSRAT